MRILAVFAVFACGGLAQSSKSGEQKQNPLAGRKDAITAGQQRFREGCAACHGTNAEGGRGPKLVKNWDLLRMTDQEIFNVIRQGIPGTSMPPSQMPGEKTWQLVAFVRNLSSPASRAFVEGDAARGRELYFNTGRCYQCHAINGNGGLQAPDLSDAGGHLTVSEMRDSMLHPENGDNYGFEGLTVHMKNGSAISGIAKNNSTYSIQVLAVDSQLYLIPKSEVASIDWKDDPSVHAEAVRAAGAEGLQDLIAFLAQQVVRPNANTESPKQQEIH